MLLLPQSHLSGWSWWRRALGGAWCKARFKLGKWMRRQTALPIDCWSLQHGLFATGWSTKVADSQAVAALCEMTWGSRRCRDWRRRQQKSWFFLFLKTRPQSWSLVLQWYVCAVAPSDASWSAGPQGRWFLRATDALIFNKHWSVNISNLKHSLSLCL